ncbi:MAG TPA: hypothetical protein DCY20_07730 [Firmicutes bacterium]|nr:hypothetical protein [Bacillota bacterium]
MCYRCQQKPQYKPESCHRPEPCDVIVIREEPVFCCEEVFFYHKVEHIVPVCVKKVVNDVYKHEYIVEKEEKIERHREDIGKKDHVNWCEVVKREDGKGCDC